MVTKFRLGDAKPVSLPALPGQILSMEQSPSMPTQMNEMQQIPYAEAIGHILWLVMISWSDVVFQVGQLAQYMKNPGMANWEALKRLICYLNTTCDLWLTLASRKRCDPIVHADAGWASQYDH